MYKIAQYLKFADVSIDISISKYLEPYQEKIKEVEKEVEDLKHEIDLYTQHLKKQMRNIVSGVKSVKLTHVFITGGFKKTPIGHFSIQNPRMDKKELENEIKQIGNFKIEIKEDFSSTGEDKWFHVNIQLDSIKSVIKKWKSMTALDFLFRDDL